MPDKDKQTLLDFAEFLKSRAPAAKAQIVEPVEIARPEAESVIAAIKRLTATYPMIERSEMFGETSDLMMQHTMSGRSGIEVIDEMEVIFERKFKDMLKDFE